MLDTGTEAGHMTQKKQRAPGQVWKLGMGSGSPLAQWTGQELYLLDPEGRTLCRLTIAQTRSLFLRLKDLSQG